MKYRIIFSTVLLMVMVFSCGCVQFPANSTPLPVTDSNDSAYPLPATTTSPSGLQPDTAKDPIIGTWECRSYLASGPLKKVYTFYNNGTWTRTNTNLATLVQSTHQGKWSNESGDNYAITSSIIFHYDPLKDEIYDPYFKETFHRIPDDALLLRQQETLILVVDDSALVSKIKGARPKSGFIFLVVNLSVENTNDPDGFSLNDKNIRVEYGDGQGTWSQNQKLTGYIENPLSPGIIPLGETRRGTVVFGIPEHTHSCSGKIINNGGELVSNIVQLQDIQEVEI
jgi:hypothetical protein